MAETEGERLRRRGDEITTRKDFDAWLHLMILWLEDEAGRERERGLARSASRRSGQALLAREVHQRLSQVGGSPASPEPPPEAGPIDVTGYIGALRRGPQGHGVVRIDNAGGSDWLMIGGGSPAFGDPTRARYPDAAVEHWPAIGAMPGTPAAWMSGEPIPDRETLSGAPDA